MSHTVIDRRLNGKGKSSPNRQRFIQRVKKHVKEGVRKIINDGKIQDIVDGQGKKVNIPTKDLKEYRFRHGTGGVHEGVLPGNKEYTQGDRINRPPAGGGGGGKDGSPDGEGEDNFQFQLTQSEFLDIFFEDLELPELVKKQISTVEEWTMKRAGFTTDGTPSRLNIMRSMKTAKARRKGLKAPKKKDFNILLAIKELIEESIQDKTERNVSYLAEQAHLEEIETKITKHKKRSKRVPFIDDVDLRYNRWDKVQIPTTKAVMFCLMDVSGSMGEWEKEMAKRFFMILYLFLTRQYTKVDVVFIRHHSTAKEVDEEEFFYSKESGGTVVSSALDLMIEVIKQRYPRQEWNIYGCQASDGDNWPDDNENVFQLMTKQILPMTQYYSYIQINEDQRSSHLWNTFERIKPAFSNFASAQIHSAKDIFPVFRGLFEKKS